MQVLRFGTVGVQGFRFNRKAPATERHGRTVHSPEQERGTKKTRRWIKHREGSVRDHKPYGKVQGERTYPRGKDPTIVQTVGEALRLTRANEALRGWLEQNEKLRGSRGRDQLR